MAIREQIQRALDVGLANQAERLPYQKMELLLSLERGEFSVDWPTWEDLGRSSILAQTPDALYLDEETIYALTHDIMFLNGFGTKRRVLPSWSDGISLRQTLSRLIVRVSQERHWDLLGELLLCWDCLGFDQTTIIQRGWTAFLAMQQDDGSFLGPERDGDQKTLADRRPKGSGEAGMGLRLPISHDLSRCDCLFYALMANQPRCIGG